VPSSPISTVSTEKKLSLEPASLKERIKWEERDQQAIALIGQEVSGKYAKVVAKAPSACALWLELKKLCGELNSASEIALKNIGESDKFA